MEKDSIFHDRYVLVRLLGRGNFSEVWLAKDNKTDIEVALKVYAPATGLDDAGLNVLAREFALVVNANHKNLLKPLYYDSYERRPYLVLPFCRQGSIMNKLGSMTEPEAWTLLRDAACGLAWLHDMTPPIIHQDIKPDNILIGDNGNYMITDFGVSIHVKSTLRKSVSDAFASAGTVAYMAPERFSKNNEPIMANDVYSLGATVYEMLTGVTPFGESGGLLQMKGAEIPALPDKFSPQLNRVIESCMASDSWLRPTAATLESYAQQALDGKNIVFENGKNAFWSRYSKIIISAAVVAVLAVVSVTYMAITSSRKTERQYAMAVAHNDSILLSVETMIDEASRLESLGDGYNEGYERDYIKSLLTLSDAMRLSQDTLLSQPIPHFADVRSDIIFRADRLKHKMEKVAEELHRKADFFKDDEYIYSDFIRRADNVNAALDTAAVYIPIP